MKLTNQELEKIYFGAYEFHETADGYLQAFQYSREQIAYFKKAFDFWYDRCTASTSKTLEFVTEAEEISFDYKILWKGSEDSFELAINERIIDIRYVHGMDEEGKLAFTLPAGSKKVTVYLPADATVVIRNFETDAPVTPAKKGTKVLWLGDSITQGFGPLRSACTYVSVANRILNYDIINQGIGGYVYDKNSIMEMPGYKPEKIIVALGTNQFGCETMKDVKEFYEQLMKVYSDTPVLCVSPLWRGDVPNSEDTLTRFCENVKKIAGSYKNVKVVDGFELVPHLTEYYLDKLHPNCFGCEVYGRNLVREIERLGF